MKDSRHLGALDRNYRKQFNLDANGQMAFAPSLPLSISFSLFFYPLELFFLNVVLRVSIHIYSQPDFFSIPGSLDIKRLLSQNGKMASIFNSIIERRSIMSEKEMQYITQKHLS